MNSNRPKLNNSNKPKLPWAAGEMVFKPESVILPQNGCDLKKTVESFETDLIRQAKERTDSNSDAARLLGLGRTTLVQKLKRIKSQ